MGVSYNDLHVERRAGMKLAMPKASMTRNGTLLNTPQRVEAQLAQELLPCGGRGRTPASTFGIEPAAGCTGRSHAGSLGRSDGLAAPASRPVPAALGFEQRERRGENRQRDARPQRAIGEDVAGDRRQAGVALFDRPVADRALQGAQRRTGRAAWPSRRCRGRVSKVAADEIQHEEADHADVDPQDAARQHRQQRQQRAGEQQVRESRTPQTSTGRESATPGRVAPDRSTA